MFMKGSDKFFRAVFDELAPQRRAGSAVKEDGPPGISREPVRSKLSRSLRLCLHVTLLKVK